MANDATARTGAFAYPTVLGLSALDAAGYSLIAPVLPAIARETGAGPAAIGALAATFPLGIVLVGFPLGGRWIQRRSAESLLVAATLVLAFGTLPFALADGLGWYFAGRLVMGIGSGGLWMGIAYATLERWPGSEYVRMSRVFAAYSAGTLFGPAFGAIGGIRAPFLAYLVFAVAGTAAALAVGPPTVRRSFHADRSALRSTGFGVAAAGLAFAVLALGVMDGVLPLHLGSELGQRAIAATFVAVAVVHAAAAALGSRLGPRRALAVSAVLVSAGIGLAGLVGSPRAWLVTLAVAAVGVGFGETGSIGALLLAVPPERSVTAMVVYSQAGIAGYLVGPLAGGVVAEGLGFGWIGVVPLAATVVLIAALVRPGRTAPRNARG